MGLGPPFTELRARLRLHTHVLTYLLCPHVMSTCIGLASQRSFSRMVCKTCLPGLCSNAVDLIIDGRFAYNYT